MAYFAVAIAAFAIFMFAMALGAIFAQKPLKGSCGGLNNFMDADGNAAPCSLCGATSPTACDSEDAV